MASVICISGLDPSGYAGLSADFRALNFLGVRCLPIASALTVQNERAFSESHPVSIGLIEKQLDSVLELETPGAIKLGMLGSSELGHFLHDYFSKKEMPIIVDPVFMSSSGAAIADESIIETYKRDLLPLSSLITPNAMEASIITGLRIENPDNARDACRKIIEMGADSVLLKGGHFKERKGTDVFLDTSGFHILDAEGLDVNVRGTGCTYSTLIAGYLSEGSDVLDAVKRAKLNMCDAISYSQKNGDSLLNLVHGYDNSASSLDSKGRKKHEDEK